jgi:predicted dehydrogenase
VGAEVTLAIVGAGIRGASYAHLAAAGGRAKVVAVAEPRADRRERLALDHGIPAGMAFSDWRELAERPRLADAVVIATQDAAHVDPAVGLSEAGYHVLLEKPMAPTEAGAERIVAAVEAAGTMLAVCHVMRYSPYTRTLKSLLDAGRVGEVVGVQHMEPIGWWHFAHSYVRGNWRRSDESSPMLLAKCCHDIDWLAHVIGRPVVRVSSFGRLTHFHAGNRPAGAAERCLDCQVEPTCPYSAPRLYLSCVGNPGREFWPLGAVTLDATEAGVLDALRHGPYGRCVYASDNDVVDQQVVALEYEGGATATLTAAAFTPAAHRLTRVLGTHGSVDGDGVHLTVHDFVSGEREVVDTRGTNPRAAGGHGGGDPGLVEAFVGALATGDPSLLLSDARTSLESHRVVWAAERARLTGSVVALDRAD